jgi:hypothetical protein
MGIETDGTHEVTKGAVKAMGQDQGQEEGEVADFVSDGKALAPEKFC